MCLHHHDKQQHWHNFNSWMTFLTLINNHRISETHFFYRDTITNLQPAKVNPQDRGDLQSDYPFPRCVTNPKPAQKQVSFMAPKLAIYICLFCSSQDQHQKLENEEFEQERLYTYTNFMEYFKELGVFQFVKLTSVILHLLDPKNEIWSGILPGYPERTIHLNL